MAQDWMAGGVVLLAALYSVWYVLPVVWRQRLGRLHPALGTQKSCGACSSCNGCAGAAHPKRRSEGESDVQVIRFHRKT